MPCKICQKVTLTVNRYLPSICFRPLLFKYFIGIPFKATCHVSCSPLLVLYVLLISRYLGTIIIITLGTLKEGYSITHTLSGKFHKSFHSSYLTRATSLSATMKQSSSIHTLQLMPATHSGRVQELGTGRVSSPPLDHSLGILQFRSFHVIRSWSCLWLTVTTMCLRRWFVLAIMRTRGGGPAIHLIILIRLAKECF